MSESGSPSDDPARANHTPGRARRNGFASETGMLPRQRPIIERGYEQTLPPLHDFEQFQGQNAGWASSNFGPPVSRYFHAQVGNVQGPQPEYRGFPGLLQDPSGSNTFQGIFIPLQSLPPSPSGYYVGEAHQYPSIPGVNMHMAQPPAPSPSHRELLPPFQPHLGIDLQQTDRIVAPRPIPPARREATRRVGPGFNRDPLAPDRRVTAPVYPSRIGPPPGFETEQDLDTRNPQYAGHLRDMPYLTESDTRPGNTPPTSTPRETFAWNTPPRSIYAKDPSPEITLPREIPPGDTPSRNTSARDTSLSLTPSRYTPTILYRPHSPPMDTSMESIFGFGNSGRPGARPPLRPGEYPANFRPAQRPSPISPLRGSPRRPLDTSSMGTPEIPKVPPRSHSALARLSSSESESASDNEVKDPLRKVLEGKPEDIQPVEGDSSGVADKPEDTQRVEGVSSGALRSGRERNPDEETEKSEETDNTLCEEPAIKAGTCCELHARLKAVIPCQMFNKIRNVLKRTMRSERRGGGIFFQDQTWQSQSQSQAS